jgi:FtsZ-binding cell division protein ZapB
MMFVRKSTYDELKRKNKHLLYEIEEKKQTIDRLLIDNQKLQNLAGKRAADWVERIRAANLYLKQAKNLYLRQAEDTACNDSHVQRMNDAQRHLGSGLFGGLTR